MKKIITYLVLILICFMVGCSGKANNLEASLNNGGGVSSKDEGLHGESGGDAEFASIPGYHSKTESGDAAPRLDGDKPSDDIASSPDANNNLHAGLLTASATDDNLKFDFWKSLLVRGQDADGVFKNYNDNYKFKTANRIKLTFPKGSVVKVNLMNGEDVEFCGVADASGVCYVFASEEKDTYNLQISYLDLENNLVTIADTVSGDKEYTLSTLNKPSELIELMFVIDATGSMGDEMEYLKAEISDVIEKVKRANANVRVRLSISVYRDKGDDYIVKGEDFSEDIAAQVDFLSKQYATGGGDFEEAVDLALADALTKSWSDTSSTKILIHVADAPAHNKDVPSWNDSILLMASKGIHIITVASSGIDKLTEYFFRCQSLLTNGMYVHITDDSGYGSGHIDATVEEKEEVELLNECLIRLINGFHTGEFSSPVNWRQTQNTYGDE